MSGFVDAYDLVIFDLDGVVYLGDQPVPGAVPVIERLHRAGVRCAFATNNASRRAADVAALLHRLGVPAQPAEVVTSAEAAAAALGDRLAKDSPVLVVGADALRAEVEAAGLKPVTSADDRPLAVVQGYGPAVGWSELAEASVAIRAGAQWIATNTDRTLPSPRGPLPGNGSLVAALATALGREPDLVVGKPAPQLFQTARDRTAAARPLVVGDRLDTDIAGANLAAMDSLLVLTGVSTARSVLDAGPQQRPTAVATDLNGLMAAPDEVRIPLGCNGTGGWSATLDGATVVLSGAGPASAALATLGAVFWSTAAHRREIRPEGPAANAALQALRLS